MEIFVGSNARKFTGSGTSMRKAKQAAASLALNEVGFKQFKTKQSRVEVGEDSSKAKVVEQIMARSQEEIVARSQGETMARAQGEIKVRSQRGGQTNKQRSRGQGWMEKGRAQESSIPRSKAGGLGFSSAMGYPSEGQVAMVDEVEGRSNKVFEQQPSTRGRKYDQAKSLRRPFTGNNNALGSSSGNGEMSKGLFNEQVSSMNAPNQNMLSQSIETPCLVHLVSEGGTALESSNSGTVFPNQPRRLILEGTRQNSTLSSDQSTQAHRNQTHWKRNKDSTWLRP